MLSNNKNNTAWRRVPALLLTAVLVMSLLAACGKGKDGKDAMPGATEGQVVASYQDGGQVTEAEFNKYTTLLELTNPQMAMYMQFIPDFKEQELKRYVIYKEYAKKATDEEKKQADEQADAFKQQLDAALKDEAQKAELGELLKQSDLNSSEVKRFVSTMIAAELAIERKRKEFSDAVTDDEIKAEFDKSPSDYNVISLRHILVAMVDINTGEETRTNEEALERAKEAKAKLDAGGEWAELAKEYSDDGGSSANGGLYENETAKSWVAAFKDAANKQPIGEIGEPVQTEYGYHVIKVEKRDEMTFEKLADTKKDEIRASIADPKLNEFMLQEQDKLEIVVTLPKEEPADDEGAANGEGEATEGEGDATEGEDATDDAAQNGAATE